MTIPDAKTAVDKEWGEVRKVAGLANDQSKEQNGGHPGGINRAKNSPFLLSLWTLVISKMRSWNRSIKNAKAGLCSVVTL